MARKKELILGIGFISIEVVLLFLFFSFIPSSVNAVLGNPNATVKTYLEVGNVFPEVINVSINEGNSITLNPNTTKVVWCTAVLRDYNGDTDMKKVNSTFYATTSSNLTALDDNNLHYSNSSCVINTSFGSYNGYNDDEYLALANCTYQVYYYAVAEPWE